MPPTTMDAAAFATAGIPLPDLSLGAHTITIKATVIGDETRTDTLIRRIAVEIQPPRDRPDRGYVTVRRGRDSEDAA